MGLITNLIRENSEQKNRNREQQLEYWKTIATLPNDVVTPDMRNWALGNLAGTASEGLGLSGKHKDFLHKIIGGLAGGAGMLNPEPGMAKPPQGPPPAAGKQFYDEAGAKAVRDKAFQEHLDQLGKEGDLATTQAVKREEQIKDAAKARVKKQLEAKEITPQEYREEIIHIESGITPQRIAADKAATISYPDETGNYRNIPVWETTDPLTGRKSYLSASYQPLDMDKVGVKMGAEPPSERSLLQAVKWANPGISDADAQQIAGRITVGYKVGQLDGQQMRILNMATSMEERADQFGTTMPKQATEVLQGKAPTPLTQPPQMPARPQPTVQQPPAGQLPLAPYQTGTDQGAPEPGMSAKIRNGRAAQQPAQTGRTVIPDITAGPQGGAQAAAPTAPTAPTAKATVLDPFVSGKTKTPANPTGDRAIDMSARNVILYDKPISGGSPYQRRLIPARVEEILDENGIDPNMVASIQGDVKSNIAAQAQNTKMQGSVDAFTKNLKKNLATAKVLSDKYDRTDIPFLDRYINAVRKGVGEGDVLAFAAQMRGVATEWGKVMQGSTGSVAGLRGSTEQELGNDLNDHISKEGFEAMFNLMQQDAANRHASFTEEGSDIRDKLSHPFRDYATRGPAFDEAQQHQQKEQEGGVVQRKPGESYLDWMTRKHLGGK